MIDMTLPSRTVDTDDFVSVSTPDSVMEYAIRRHESTPLYRSNTDNSRRVAAFAAEGVVGTALNAAIEGETETTFDVSYSGAKYDVKTVQRNVESRLDFEMNVSASSFEHQKDTDFYIFADANTDGSVLTFVGMVSREEFEQKRVHHKKGTVKNSKAGAVWPADYYSIKVSDLHPLPDDFRAALEGLASG